MTAPVQYSQDNPFAPGKKYSADNPFATAGADFSDVQGGSSTDVKPPQVGHAEGLGRAALQGPTLGLSDELEGVIAAGGGSDLPHLGMGLARALTGDKSYTDPRDYARERLREYSDANPGKALTAEIVGSLPTAGLGAGMGAARTGAAFGALSGFGHGEGDIKKQAEATGLGAAIGGIGGGLMHKAAHTWLGERIGSLLPGGAKRQAIRAAATLINPDEAAGKIAAREALAPGQAVLGDLNPSTSELATVLGRDARSAITGPEQASARSAAINAARKGIGSEYDAINQALEPDDEIRFLAERAGQPLPEEGPVDFATLHRLRHDVSKAARSARGMAANDLWDIRNGLDNWLQNRIEGLADIDKRYATVSDHLAGALRSQRAMGRGVMQAARREAGGNTRGANRPLGVFHWLSQALNPSAEASAEATQQALFNPANTQSSLNAIRSARERIMHPSTRPEALFGQGAGAVMAPQLSNNPKMGQIEAVQLRSQGLSDAQLEQMLSQRYTPEVVRFLVASTPQRVPQQ